MTSFLRRALIAAALMLAAGCQSAKDAPHPTVSAGDKAQILAGHKAGPEDLARLKGAYDGLSKSERTVITSLLKRDGGKVMIARNTASAAFWQDLHRLGLANEEETARSMAKVGQTYSLTAAGRAPLHDITGLPPEDSGIDTPAETEAQAAAAGSPAGAPAQPAPVPAADSRAQPPCRGADCRYIELACGDLFDSAGGKFTLPRREYQRLYLYAMGYFLAASGKRQIPGQSMRTNMVLLAKQCAQTPEISLVEALAKTARVVETRGPERQKALWPQKNCNAVFGKSEPAYQGRPAEMPYLIELVMGYYSAHAAGDPDRVAALSASKSVLPPLVSLCRAQPNLNFSDALKATIPWS